MGIFMSAVLPAILTMVISYLLGSINSSIIFTKLFSHEDIREMGSGNAGTTNVLRSVGKRAAACTFAFDFIKGVLAVFIGRLLFQYFAAAYPLAGVSSWEFVQYGAYLAGLDQLVHHSADRLAQFCCCDCGVYCGCPADAHCIGRIDQRWDCIPNLHVCV